MLQRFFHLSSLLFAFKFGAILVVVAIFSASSIVPTNVRYYILVSLINNDDICTHIRITLNSVDCRQSFTLARQHTRTKNGYGLNEITT